MKTLVYAGIATSALLLSMSPASASDSFAPTAKGQISKSLISTANGTGHGKTVHPRMGNMGMGGHGVGMPGRAGHGVGMAGGHGVSMPRVNHVRMNNGGVHNIPRHNPTHQMMRPRPGSNGIPRNDRYRQPFRGFILPSYWVNPSFSIGNYGSYGLSQPSNGYNWSRYYDDAVLTDQRGYVYDYRPSVNWNAAPAGYAPNGGYQPAYGPSIQADNQVYGWGDASSDPSIGGQREAGTYEGAWTGGYVDPQRQVYRGQWDGTYTNEQGQSYQGSYRGTATGDPVYQSGPANYGPQPAPAYDDRDYGQGPQGYETCLRNNGVKGAAIGAVLGGVVGNRVAGDGKRLGGSLLGAGVGGIAGSVIEKAISRCKKYQPREEYRPPVAQNYPPQYYPAPQPYPTQQQYPVQQQYPAQQAQSYGWQGGGYYYPQPTTTTVSVVPGETTTTTTTTEEVTYETVYYTPKRKAPVRKWKPRAKVRKAHCHCH
jgi:Ni/Co efflux regulator RcnB